MTHQDKKASKIKTESTKKKEPVIIVIEKSKMIVLDLNDEEEAHFKGSEVKNEPRVQIKTS